MLKKSSQLFFRGVIIVSLILVVASVYLIRKEHETLARLMNPGMDLQTTDVYSRWLELKTDERPSWGRVLAWVNFLDYHSVPGAPANPGDYHAAYPELIISLSGLSLLSDKDFPAQLLDLHFLSKGMDHMQALSGHVSLEEWRLAPARLAQWAAGSKTARVEVRISELPPYVPRAVMAIEDKRFFEHGAFDVVGIGRALWVDLAACAFSWRQGGEHHQPAARTLYFSGCSSHLAPKNAGGGSRLLFGGSLSQTAASGDVSQSSLLGTGWSGQPHRHRVRESISLWENRRASLSVAESAILAGMLQSPNRYSPRSALNVSDERAGKLFSGLMRDQK